VIKRSLLSLFYEEVVIWKTTLIDETVGKERGRDNQEILHKVLILCL
jgi:hypothetical protein